MKRSLRLTAWLLICILLISATGCGKGENPSGEKEEDSDNQWMEGYDYTLVTESDANSGVFGYGDTMILYDVMMERFRTLEEKYGCTITVGYTPVVLDEADITSKIMAGQHFAEIFRASSNNHPAMFCRAGVLVPLPDLAEWLDYENEAKFGNVAALECAMVDSVPYAIAPVSLPMNMGSGSFLIAFNRDYVAEYGLNDPHEYYESKSWTFESLSEILETWYLGPDAHPHYVLSGPTRGFAELALLNNGVRFVTEEDGQLVTDIYSPSSVHAIEWLQDIEMKYGKTSLYHPADYWDTSTFINGDTFMSLAAGSAVSFGAYQYNCDYKIGLMPFPNGPDAEYGQFSTYLEAGAAYMFPITIDWEEAAATVTSDLFEPFEDYGGRDGMFAYYQANVFLDDIDTDIFMHHLDYARYTYWNFGGLGLSVNIANSLGSKTATELLEAYGPAYEKVIDKEIKGNYEYLKTHMYNR